MALSMSRGRLLRLSLLDGGAIAVPMGAVAVRAQDAMWTGGSGAWNDPTGWDGGTMPAATDNALVDGGEDGIASAVTVTNGTTINDMIIDAGDSMSVDTAQTFTRTGDLINDGSFTLNAIGSSTRLDIVGGSAVSGSGTVQ